MKRILFASLAIAVVGLPVVPETAFAQQSGKGAPPAKADDKPANQRVKNFDFEADELSGELVKPEGEFLAARKFAEHGSLIRVRTDFIREIVKSAEDL